MIGNDARFVSAFGRAVLDKTELGAVVAKAVKAGFAVVLCEPGTKRPVCTLVNPTTRARADKAAREAAKAAGVQRWDRVRHDCGLKHALEDPDKAKALYVKVQAQYEEPLNLAIVTGRSRMVCVDLDTPEQLEAFGRELTVQSPGTRDAEGNWAHHGGGHIWFELPSPVVLPDGPGKYVDPEGGWVAMWGESYALVPPSRRPEGAYTFSSGDIEVVPPFLLGKILAEPERDRGEGGPKGPGDPADEWAAGVQWETLLSGATTEENRWISTGKIDACGCPIWMAPGGRADQKSATAHEAGCPRTDTSTGHGPLHIWTDAPPKFLEGRRNVTKLQYLACRDHGGNVAAAMRAEEIASSLVIVPESVNASEDGAEAFTRIVDLDRWLDDSYVAPSPTAGAQRDDERTMLYPGKWHTVIGQTTAGKSWFALWHAKAVLDQGGTVAYVHFEEGDPGNTLHRLAQLGVDKDTIRKQFVWLSNERMWQPTEMSGAMAKLAEEGRSPQLLILDGLIAGTSRQGWKVNDPESVGLYRITYVRAATALGAAVLSLGHPVKDRTRQDEIHGFGSTAWLDEVDGCSFRLEAATQPIRKGHKGSSWVSVVKDRAGSVAELCELHEGKSETWYTLGEFVMDDTQPEFGGTGQHTTFIHLVPPRMDESTAPETDKIDLLGQQIITWLSDHGGRYEGKNGLMDELRADGIGFREEDVEPALIRLEAASVIEREPFRKGRSRAGWLVEMEVIPSDSK
jgi:hypothetical protein